MLLLLLLHVWSVWSAEFSEGSIASACIISTQPDHVRTSAPRPFLQVALLNGWETEHAACPVNSEQQRIDRLINWASEAHLYRMGCYRGALVFAHLLLCLDVAVHLHVPAHASAPADAQSSAQQSMFLMLHACTTALGRMQMSPACVCHPCRTKAYRRDVHGVAISREAPPMVAAGERAISLNPPLRQRHPPAQTPMMLLLTRSSGHSLAVIQKRY